MTYNDLLTALAFSADSAAVLPSLAYAVATDGRSLPIYSLRWDAAIDDVETTPLILDTDATGKRYIDKQLTWAEIAAQIEALSEEDREELVWLGLPDAAVEASLLTFDANLNVVIDYRAVEALAESGN